jgi:hypothetical protein
LVSSQVTNSNFNNNPSLTHSNNFYKSYATLAGQKFSTRGQKNLEAYRLSSPTNIATSREKNIPVYNISVNFNFNVNLTETSNNTTRKLKKSPPPTEIFKGSMKTKNKITTQPMSYRNPVTTSINLNQKPKIAVNIFKNKYVATNIINKLGNSQNTNTYSNIKTKILKEEENKNLVNSTTTYNYSNTNRTIVNSVKTPKQLLFKNLNEISSEKRINAFIMSPTNKPKSNTNFESFINANKKTFSHLTETDSKREDKKKMLEYKKTARNHSFQEKNKNFEFGIKRNTTISNIKYVNTRDNKEIKGVYKNNYNKNKKI